MDLSWDLVLTEGQVVLPHTNGPHIKQADIAIKDGKIIAIGSFTAEEKSKCKKIQNVKNLHVLPGVIDSQVHMRDPGLTHKEDLETGTRGALLGGVTTVFEMPNTTPPTSTIEALEEKFLIAAKKGHTNYAFFVGATPQNVEQLAALEKHPNTPGVKVFMGSSTGQLLVEEDQHLEKLLRFTKYRVAVHAEDEARLRERKQIAIDGAHARFHPIWRDEQTAFLATERILKLARLTQRKLHLLHITTSSEMDLLKNNKDIATVEVLPQHLTFEAPDCYERFGTLAQMNPPIREKRHQERLWKAIQDRTVDVIASDHAPHTLEEKNKTYPQSPSGFPGVQTLLPLMLTHVNKGRLNLERLVELVCEGPARVYNAKNKGFIQVGADADFSIVDLKKIKKIEKSWIASKCGWSLYENMEMHGWPIMTILGGEICMQDDQIIKPLMGRPVIFGK